MTYYRVLANRLAGAFLATLPLVPLLAETQNISKQPLFLGDSIDPSPRDGHARQFRQHEITHVLGDDDTKDLAHTNETVAWMVMESGTHQLPGDSIAIQAGRAEEPSDSELVSFADGVFTDDAPVVMASRITKRTSASTRRSRVHRSR